MDQASGADAVFASPRWSPDGRRIAAERRLRGGQSEIVVVDLETHDVTVAVTSQSGRNVTPAWTADGHALLFASDRSGGPFDLYRVLLDDDGHAKGLVQRMTEQPGGARSPDVSRDGRHARVRRLHH